MGDSDSAAGDGDRFDGRPDHRRADRIHIPDLDIPDHDFTDNYNDTLGIHTDRECDFRRIDCYRLGSDPGAPRQDLPRRGHMQLDPICGRERLL